MSWRDLTDEERMALEPGTKGWKYRPGTLLIKGQWMEELREPERYKTGGVCTKILWCSNGVGTPSMILVGSLKDYDPPAKIGSEEHGYFIPLPKGGYRPALFGGKYSYRPKPSESGIAVGNIKSPMQKAGKKGKGE